MLRSGEARARSGRRTRVFRWLGVAAILVVTSACGVGKWSLNSTPAPVRAVHAALLKNGHVLLIQGSGNDPNLFAANTFTTTEWNPVANTFRTIPTPYDMFCSGHAALPDGRLLVAGGTTAYPVGDTQYKGSKESYAFDPTTHAYVKAPDLAEGHWYPTLVNRGDGTMIVVGGVDDNAVLQSNYQVFDPAGNSGAGSLTAQQPTAQFFATYPALHLLADGRFFYSGVSTFGVGGEPPGFWDATANTFTPVSGLPAPDRRDMGASVLLPPAQSQKVMVMGGGLHNDPTVTATASTAIIDLTSSTPSYVAGPPLSEAKQYVSAVILPDRTVLQTGGSNESWYDRNEPDFAYRYTAQIFHPDTGKWEDAAPSTVGRTYHSEALLLPDGRVATFGGNASDTGADFEMRIELYTPDYVSKPRPTLTVGTDARTIARGGSTTFTSDRTLKWVHVIRPSAATHSNDPDQRLVDLPFTQTGTSVVATLDANPNLTPPGWYLLFGVDTAGAPSVATWVHVT